MAIPCQIHVHTAIGKLHLAITRKPIGNDRQSLVAFDITGAFEELVENGHDNGF